MEWHKSGSGNGYFSHHAVLELLHLLLLPFALLLQRRDKGSTGADYAARSNREAGRERGEEDLKAPGDVTLLLCSFNSQELLLTEVLQTIPSPGKGFFSYGVTVA